jgi:XTP/dITP diphosphohydrolase
MPGFLSKGIYDNDILEKIMSQMIIATKNILKFFEIDVLLKDVKTNLIFAGDLKDCPDVIEDGKTLYENCIKKAKEIAAKYNIPCIADDSGLFIRSLNFKPGIHTARYAGLESNSSKNIKKVLTNMIGETDRFAYFTTVCCLYCPKVGLVATCEGKIEGYITEEEKGVNGFGYDPIFVPMTSKRSYAQMSNYDKNKMSHRFIAFSGLKKDINNYLKEHKND